MQLPDHAQIEHASRPVIDRAVMAEMWEDAGPELFQRIARLFEGERRRYVAHMQDALRSDDRAGLQREAHSLKSAAAYICAESLRVASLHLEQAALSAEPASLAQMIEDIAVAADIADAELARAISEMINGF